MMKKRERDIEEEKKGMKDLVDWAVWREQVPFPACAKYHHCTSMSF